MKTAENNITVTITTKDKTVASEHSQNMLTAWHTTRQKV